MREHLTDAVAAGVKVAKANMPSQLTVLKQDGAIEYEHTYGNDPYPPRKASDTRNGITPSLPA